MKDKLSSELFKSKLRFAKIIVILFSILLLFLVIISQFVFANVSKDVRVIITLENATENTNYTRFIKLINNDDEINFNDNLSLEVNIFTLHFNYQTNETNEINETSSNYSTINSSWTVIKTINSYSETGFGTLNILNHNLLLCVNATPLNFYDYDLTNNYVCKQFILSSSNFTINESSNLSTNDTSNDTSNITNSSFDASNLSNISNISNISTNLSNISDLSNISNVSDVPDLSNLSNVSNLSNISDISNLSNISLDCSCHLKISSAQQIYERGDKLIFEINDCSSNSKFNQSVEYWIEDSRGIVKAKINTTSKSDKSYTPTFDVQEKYYLVRAKFSLCEFTSERLVVFKSSESEIIKNTHFELTIPEDEDSDVVYVKVDGYKANTAKTLVSIWLEKSGKKYSDVTKFYVLDKYSFFSLKLPVLLDVKDSGSYKVVVEGLDEREEKSIKIIRYEEFDENQNQDETSYESENKNNVESKIVSFYTLKKIFAQNITVYVNVQNPLNYSLQIITSKQNYVLKDLSTKNTVNISILSENETLIAKLIDNEKVVDTKYLKLNLTKKTKGEITEGLQNVYLNLTSRDLLDGNGSGNGSINDNNNLDASVNQNRNIAENYQVNSISKGINNGSNMMNKSDLFPPSSSTNKLTGAVVFENVQFNKTNSLFILVAIVVCFMLFHKKTKQKIMSFIKELLKKTKFFK